MKEKSAYELGKEAYKKGLKDPYQDKKFINSFLKGKKVGDKDNVKALDQWQKGWHELNLGNKFEFGEKKKKENKTLEIKNQVKEIKKEFNEITKEIDSGSKNKKRVSATLKVLKDKMNNFKSSDEFKEVLDTFSKFHDYSARNKELIHIQSQGQATLVNGYKKWQDLGRHVKKGEKGMRILAPRTYKKEVKKTDSKGNYIKDKEGNIKTEKKKYTYFVTVSVFDISQTKGDPLPKLDMKIEDNISDLQKPLLKLADDNNIEVNFKSAKDDSVLSKTCHGYSKGGEIVINSDKDIDNQTATLIHESAHEDLHKISDRASLSKEQKELEADAVKYVTLKRYGVDSKSEKYMALYHEDYDIQESLERISNTSSKIIKEIDEFQNLKLKKKKLNQKTELINNLKEEKSKLENKIKKINNKKDINIIKKDIKEINKKVNKLNGNEIKQEKEKIDKKLNKYDKYLPDKKINKNLSIAR